MSTTRDHLIVALDVPTQKDALDLVDQLADQVGAFKIGLQLYTAEGPKIVREVRARGGEVFLDLKLHDIPNTVAKAVEEACRLGVKLLTLHTFGGREMLSRAAQTAAEFRKREGRAPELLGVTVLTSLDQSSVEELGYRAPLQDLVSTLAHLAAGAKIDGVVCSPLELERLQPEVGDRLFFVTPGIRPAGTSADDQRRVLTAGDAIRAGARYLVIGRPITRADSPLHAAQKIAREIEAAKLGT